MADAATAVPEAADAGPAPGAELVASQHLETLSLVAPSTQLPQQMPRISGKGVVTTDITAKFKASAALLQPGELVKDGHFTLFESVAALEGNHGSVFQIMDPKMDSGCVPEDDEPEFQVSRPLLPAEMLGIMDQLLCVEMAWHLGYPLAQTLFTSIYLTSILLPVPQGLAEADFVRGRSQEDLAKSPTHLVLRAFCIGLIKMCSRVIASASLGLYYEDEDFSTHTHNVPLLEDVSDDEVHQVLEQARETVLGASSLEQGWDEAMSSAVLARLEFRDAFHTALELAELRVQPDALKVPWQRMKAAVPEIQKTHALSVPVEASFSIKMQTILAGGMPPRSIVQPTFEEACRNWLQLAEDGAEAVGILAYSDPRSLLNFVLTLMSKKPQPLVCIRTLLQGLLFTDNIMLGALSIRQVMDGDLAISVLPCSVLLDPINDDIEAVQDPRFIISQKMEDFRRRAFRSYLEIFRSMCQNRSRDRRLLIHVLDDWEHVQLDAEDLDKALQVELDRLAQKESNGPSVLQEHEALPLSSWAFLFKLQVMEWVVQLGFELDVYQADEMAGMYWYLCYLAKRRVQHAERIRTFTVRSLEERQRQGQSVNKGRGSAPLTKEEEAAFRQSLLFLRTTMLDASVTWEMADALSCIYAALGRCGSGLLPVPAPKGRPYSTDELRYELRMRPFARISLPELPTFEMYRDESMQADSSVLEVLQYAEKALSGAKKGCEAFSHFKESEAFSVNCHARWLARTKDTHKSAIFMGLAVAALKREVERAGKEGQDSAEWKLQVSVELPRPDQRYHEWWVVPKITASK